MISTEFGCPFVLKSDNGPCYTSREFHHFLEFYKVHHITSSIHHPQSNGFTEASVGILKKLMEKSIKDGKPWNYGLLQYRVIPIAVNLWSPLEALTGRRPKTSLPQIPFSVGKTMETSRIRKELMRHQPSTSTHSPMELEPGQPVFMKEVHGNVWKTSTINQPTKEPESYWVKFSDNCILRRTRSMIEPWSQPSHFRLKAEGRERNSRGQSPAHSHHPFNSNLQAPGMPALPVDSLVPLAMTSKATLTATGHIPVSSTSTTQTSITSSDLVEIPSTSRQSSWPNKGIPPVRFTPPKKWLCVPYGTLWKPVEKATFVYIVFCVGLIKF